ncbi:hypothetical protein [Variovorax sp. N23]|uniref:hypothetical protein n=1 Tax=Variovorax sp. N23 TaxID=2980555 RepID=UPI0021CA0DFB|nr:hypothetical protein [Variovorax sp. N23]MCU4119360.1 hypothetical protein [Variovorax sp. N23]
MKERPILFSAPMVRALLAGTKTQTRRLVKGLNDRMWIEDTAAGGFAVCYDGDPCCGTGVWDVKEHAYPIVCPYGVPGDRLWVRENGWERPERTPRQMREGADTWAPYYFDADGLSRSESEDFKAWGFKRRPSIHMPRWASRILLEVTEVRVERLQDISEADSMAEGVDMSEPITMPFSPGMEWCTVTMKPRSAREAYAALWESINDPGAWDANPWVWAVSFRVLPPGGGAI